MPSHMRRMRMVKRHAGHKPGHKKKGMHSRHRHKTTHKKTHHAKHKQHGHKKTRATHKAGSRTAGAGKPSRRMDSYHMRRRFMHAGAAGALGVGVFGYDDEMEDNPFIDEALFDDEGLLEDFVEEGSESSSSEEEAQEEEQLIDGPPPLESEDHFHAFFYHSSAIEDQEQVDHYVTIIESRVKKLTRGKNPHDLKVLTSEKDFKSELNATQNLMLAIGLSQKTILHCTGEFIENDLANFESAVQHVLSEDERKNRVIILLGADVELPASLQRYPKVLSLANTNCFELLTNMLMTTHARSHHLHSSNDRSHPEPSAPPIDGVDSPTPHHMKEELHTADAKEPTTNYPNGLLIKRVTACNFTQYERQDVERGFCVTYCPRSDILCPRPEPEYVVPEALTKRGLQVTKSEFAEILHSLNEAANVTFFEKAVDCTLPCLFLSTILTVSFISCSLWFLVAGVTHHYQDDRKQITSSLFWSFMVLIFIIPAFVACIMVFLVLHLANYKYLKYRIKVEEFNKRFRETNLVLHVRKGFWTCSGKLKLFFIYYNFEDCQQTLYCHVHDDIVKSAESYGGENEKLLNDIATVKLDKIMKRVNTLTKKFEWSYFDALTTNKLPNVDQKEHRKKGMCFCQFVLHNEQKSNPPTIVDHVKGQVVSLKKNALKKSHKRRDPRDLLPPRYLAPTLSTNGTSRFSDKKSSSVTFI
ncbi:uncharacterized protein [Watersipora subatra]|uniref:uncharacterized protein n=1 Tax=Watersipora subatra TaxID=2589382 RepID=UPI00355C6525